MTIMRQQSPKTAEPGQQRHKQRPQRTCIGCRTAQNSCHLLRLACTPLGQVVVDITGRMPGRGGYVCYHPTCLQKALHPTKLSLTFHQAVISLGFNEAHTTIVHALSTRLQRCLGMAQKAGAVVSGNEALRQALAHATVQCLILAEDAVAARVAEYHTLCATMHISCERVFSKDALGHCIGKSPRMALGLRTTQFCDLFCNTLQLLRQLQTS